MGATININQVLGEVGDTRPVVADGPICVSAGTVAGAGSSSSADATVTSFAHTTISSTTANGGIRFDSFVAGVAKSVKNYASASVLVYPPTGGAVNRTAIDTAFTLTSGTGAVFISNAENDLFTVS